MDSFRYLITAVFIVVAALGGFLAGKAQREPVKPAATTPQTQSVLSNALFKSQTATFQGEVLKVAGQNLEVKDDRGQSGSFPISTRLAVYKYTQGTTAASASSDLKAIDTGKQALLMLELLDGKYQVVSVSYLPPPPKL